MQIITILRLAYRSSMRHLRRTLISAVAVAFGVALTLFFLGFADGVYNQLIGDAARLQSGHLTVQHRDYLDAPAIDLFIRDARQFSERAADIPGVLASKRLIHGQGMARSGVDSNGVAIMGIDPEIEASLSPIAKHITEGEYLDGQDQRWVLIGDGMARRLDLAPGKKLVLSANDINGDLVEELFRVRGIFHSGEPGLDGYVIQMPINAATDFYNMPTGAATDLGIVLENRSQRRAAAIALSTLIADREDLRLLGWEEIQPGLAAYIKTDRGSLLFFAAILIALTLFTIFNTVLMSVLERRREFAVQLAIGVDRRELSVQILIEAAILGLLGCAIGTLIGMASLAYFGDGIDMMALMGGSEVSVGNFAIQPIIYPELGLRPALGVLISVFVATLVTGLVPIRLIGRMKLGAELRA
jgi:putative ABC transport system permease protein